jgi:SAM-dependent methyltransferase
MADGLPPRRVEGMGAVFERTWLELREPADIEARDADLLERAAALLDEPGSVVLDLGCGTGATVRAVSPLLRRPVQWRLVDNDPILLSAAAAALSGERVETVSLDIAQLKDLPLTGVSLVTASALFDLCSASFVEEFAKYLAERKLDLYAALNYDGAIVWEPPHRCDTRMVELFSAHAPIRVWVQLWDRMPPECWPRRSRVLALKSRWRVAHGTYPAVRKRCRPLSSKGS